VLSGPHPELRRRRRRVRRPRVHRGWGGRAGASREARALRMIHRLDHRLSSPAPHWTSCTARRSSYANSRRIRRTTSSPTRNPRSLPAAAERIVGLGHRRVAFVVASQATVPGQRGKPLAAVDLLAGVVAAGVRVNGVGALDALRVDQSGAALAFPTFLQAQPGPHDGQDLLGGLHRRLLIGDVSTLRGGAQLRVADRPICAGWAADMERGRMQSRLAQPVREVGVV
jgi:hypothetical protein